MNYLTNPSSLTWQNINKALGTMRQMASIGVNKKGFDKLISTRFYNQIVRPQLEYRLAISTFNLRNIRELENCQNQCLRIKNRIAILQAKFIYKSLSLPDDSLLMKMLPYLKSVHAKSKWSKIANSSFWKTLTDQANNLSPSIFKSKRIEFLRQSYVTKLQEKHSKLLACCRPELAVDSILRLPMTRIESGRCLRWRFGWLSLGKP
ncbi:hypothetical protein INT46_003620 [Mucor plumbeus]|uniref:Uncharacterized protein n=1 Tax=Mucor plumbeus TaxID=97098 RepID=A0A8H7VBZ6_9FUNG|nr:hypothetical protein INT46_003620 [Mucor plumbeus]